MRSRGRSGKMDGGDEVRVGRLALRVEALEARHMFSASGSVSTPEWVEWAGRPEFAFRDSYVLRMPQTNAAASEGVWDYVSATPHVRHGWTVRSLGMGYFALETKGASAAEVTAWAHEVGVESISPNAAIEKQALPRKTPNDTRFKRSQQWGLDNLGVTTGTDTRNFPVKADADIDAPEAWTVDPNNQNTGSKRIIVAVMDDGIDYRHLDLQQNMWQRPASVPDTVAGRFGWDSADGDRDDPSRNYYATLPAFGNSHGTAIAGIIGAKGNNERGVSGVNWDVSLYDAKIFRDSGGDFGGIDAFVDAVNRIIELKTRYDQQIVAVNASFMSYDPAYRRGTVMWQTVQRLGQAGILFVTAAGNGFDPDRKDNVGDLNDPTGDLYSEPVWPGNYTRSLNNVITVAASTANDTLARFSNWGSYVDIAAPGENIWSTVTRLPTTSAPPPRPLQYPGHESIDIIYGTDQRLRFRHLDDFVVTDPNSEVAGYGAFSGTSMSAAFVSGTVALAAAEYQRWTRVLPTVTYLRSAVVDRADSVSTLTYTESASPTPYIAGDVMYGTAQDPFPGLTHAIAGNRRLNAYNTIKWVRENLPPKVMFANASVVEGDTGMTDVVLAATLWQNTYRADGAVIPVPSRSPVPLTVLYWTSDYPGEATVGDGDYVPVPKEAPRSFVIPAGVSEFRVPLPGIVRGDGRFESNERFVANFRIGANTDAWLASDTVAVEIRNDDPSDALPAVSLDATDQTVREGNGGSASPTTVIVPVTLDRVAQRTVLIPYEIKSLTTAGASPATEGVDFVAQSGTLRVEAGQRGGSIPVRIIGDTIVDTDASGVPSPRESFVVRLLAPNGGLLKQAVPEKRIAIEDDDRPTVPPPPPSPMAIASFTGPAGGRVREGEIAVYEVTLSSPVAGGFAAVVQFMTVNGSAKAGSDFTGFVSGRLVIPAGSSSGRISIQVARDAIREASETFSVRILRADYVRTNSSVAPQSINVRSVGPVTTTIDDVAVRAAVASAGAAWSSFEQPSRRKR